MRNITSYSRCFSPKRGDTHYQGQLGFTEKGRAIKELIICRTFNQFDTHQNVNLMVYP